MTAATASPLAGLDDDTIRTLLNVGATFAALQIAADVLEKTAFDDEDVTGIEWLPMGLRTHTVARVLDATESLREELREIDGRVLRLARGGAPVGPPPGPPNPPRPPHDHPVG